MMDNKRPDLGSIVGDELSAVCFVRDYVELHFDGPVLRLLGEISVANSGEVQRENSEHFKNWLCRNIGRRLARVDTIDANEISLKFHGNDVIKVIGRQAGNEFAHYISFPEKRMQIWEAE